MMRFRLLLAATALLCSTATSSWGDVITSYSVNSPIEQGSNGGSADLTINIRANAGESYGAYVNGFRIVDGSSIPVPNAIASNFASVNAFGSGAGVTSFGVAPFFSNGNVDSGSYFRTVSSSEVELSLLTQSGGVIIPSIDTPLARFQINTNLAPGTYNILALPQDIQSATGVSLPFSFSPGSFTIVSAVPEPTSLLLMSAVGLGFTFVRRRKCCL
jgi:PEP-CTERM motif